jgi:hypothetical protein
MSPLLIYQVHFYSINLTILITDLLFKSYCFLEDLEVSQNVYKSYQYECNSKKQSKCELKFLGTEKPMIFTSILMLAR